MNKPKLALVLIQLFALVAIVTIAATTFTPNDSNLTVSGNLTVAGITNTAISASSIKGTDANKAEVSLTLSTGISMSGTTLTAGSLAWITNITAQTTSITTATLYTAPATGLYRVSGVIEATTAGSAGTITLTLGWTDGIGATTSVPLSLFTLAVTGRSQITSTVMQVTSGQVITYATATASVVGNPQYALRLVVEKLN